MGSREPSQRNEIGRRHETKGDTLAGIRHLRNAQDITPYEIQVQ